MANDVELSVGADVGQAKASVSDLRKVFEEFFSSFGLGKEQVQAWSEAFTVEFTKSGASVEEAKARLEELRPVFEDARKAASEAAGSSGVGGFSFSLKDMAKSAGAGISVLSVLRENYEALQPTLEKLRDLTVSYADSLGFEREKTQGLLDRIGALIDPRKIVSAITKDAARASKEIADAMVGESAVVVNLTEKELKLAEAKGLALRAGQDREAAIRKEREENAALADALAATAAAEIAAGEVSKRTRDDIEALNQTYADAGDEIPPKFAAIVAQLGILTTEQEKAGEEAERLAERSVEAAERRAAAEEEATKREVAASEQRAAAALAASKAAVDAADQEIAAGQKRLEEALAKGGKIDTSTEGSGGSKAAQDAASELDKVKGQISELEGLPIISLEQMNQLDGLKNRARELTRGMEDANKVFTVTGENFLTEAEAAEAANAAWDVHIGLLKKAASEQDYLIESQRQQDAAAEAQAAANERLSDSLGQVGDGYSEAADMADSAAASFEDAAGAVDGLVANAEAVQGAAGGAAEAMGDLSDAVSEVGQGEGGTPPFGGVREGLEKAATGARDAAKAVRDWTADLVTAEEIIDRIAAKLAGLQLGS